MKCKLAKILPFTLAFTGILALSSCLKPQTYPDEPMIENPSYEIQEDTLLILSVDFTDGDGDVGLGPADTLDSFSSSSFFHYNLYIEYYEMMEGQWVKGTQDPSGENFPLADTINFQYRIKNLTPIGQNKTLKGSINVTLESFYNPLSNHNDSVKFRISLIDRSLNISNFVETDLITPSL